jgi:hypothetical protein
MARHTNSFWLNKYVTEKQHVIYDVKNQMQWRFNNEFCIISGAKKEPKLHISLSWIEFQKGNLEEVQFKPGMSGERRNQATICQD